MFLDLHRLHFKASSQKTREPVNSLELSSPFAERYHAERHPKLRCFKAEASEFTLSNQT